MPGPGNLENFLPRNAVRDVDKLLAVTDGKLAQQDKEYLERHDINGLFNELLSNLLTLKPLDPVQYIIDSVEFSPDVAKQDPTTGLPEHRRLKLLDVFRVMDKEGRGQISFAGLEEFTRKHGGDTLTDQDLKSIFRDFHPNGGSLITLQEFLQYYAKVSRTMPNKAFMQMVKDLLS